eukprot:6060820-Amphidinium_carterae.1
MAMIASPSTRQKTTQHINFNVIIRTKVFSVPESSGQYHWSTQGMFLNARHGGQPPKERPHNQSCDPKA